MRHFAEFAEPEFPYDDSIPEETEEEAKEALEEANLLENDQKL